MATRGIAMPAVLRVASSTSRVAIIPRIMSIVGFSDAHGFGEGFPIDGDVKAGNTENRMRAQSISGTVFPRGPVRGRVKEKDEGQGKTEMDGPLDHGRKDHISRGIKMKEGHGYGHDRQVSLATPRSASACLPFHLPSPEWLWLFYRFPFVSSAAGRLFQIPLLPKIFFGPRVEGDGGLLDRIFRG